MLQKGGGVGAKAGNGYSGGRAQTPGKPEAVGGSRLDWPVPPKPRAKAQVCALPP